MPAPRPPGIRDVADAAGVSPTTVSHALNGKGRIAPETRARVIEAAERLGYVPNRNARNLVRGRQGAVALRIAGNVEGSPEFTNWDVEYFMRLVTGAFGAANESNLQLVFRSFDEGSEFKLTDTGETGESSAAESVEGLIVVDPPPDLRLGSEFDGLPFVTTGRIPASDEDPEPDNPYWVDNDNVAATMTLLDHMADQGAKSIALITPTPVASVTVDCERAYAEWARERGQQPSVELAEYGIGETAGHHAATQLLDGSDPPDAILSTMQGLAIGALFAVREKGLEVPKDMMIAAFCNGLGGAGNFASITAMDLSPELIGSRAMRLIADLIDGSDPEEPQVIVPTELMVRNSTLRKG